MRHLGTVRPEAVDRAQGPVAQLEGVFMLGVVADMGVPPVQGTHFARLPLEVAPLAALKRFRREVNQRVGPDLQPVALPRGHRRFSALLLDGFPPHTSLHGGRCLRRHQVTVAAAEVAQDALGALQRGQVRLGEGVAVLQDRVVQQVMPRRLLTSFVLQMKVVGESIDVIVGLAENAARNHSRLVRSFNARMGQQSCCSTVNDKK